MALTAPARSCYYLTMNAAQGIWPILIAAAAVAVPAGLGLYYFAAQRSRERATVTNALRSEIDRLTVVLVGYQRWIEKPQSRELPLVAFETGLYDSHQDKIGTLESRFATKVVLFYGALHFINALQKVRADYYKVTDGDAYFERTYSKAIRKALKYVPSKPSTSDVDSRTGLN